MKHYEEAIYEEAMSSLNSSSSSHPPHHLPSGPKPPLRRPKPYQIKNWFKLFIHFNYLAGFLYAFYYFVTTPRSSQMFVRRLWAYECWLILSFYGLFIYLFYLEKSALDEERGLFRFMKIRATALIEAGKDELLTWFDQIAAEPQQYQFKTHQGVSIESGSLTEPGSVFTTQEKFLGITLKLRFTVTAADPALGLEFKLITPGLSWLGIRGRFDYQLLEPKLIRLDLTIFNHPSTFLKRIVSGAFYLSPLRLLVARQISREVRFIRRGVEEFEGCKVDI